MGLAGCVPLGYFVQKLGTFRILRLKGAVLARPSCPNDPVGKVCDRMPVTRALIRDGRLLEPIRRLRCCRGVAIEKAFDQISKYVPSE